MDTKINLNKTMVLMEEVILILSLIWEGEEVDLRTYFLVFLVEDKDNNNNIKDNKEEEIFLVEEDIRDNNKEMYLKIMKFFP